VRECEITLATLRDAARLTREAEQQIARVRSRAAADGPAPRALSQTKKAAASRANAKKQSRPIDLLRRALVQSGARSVTSDEAAALLPKVGRRQIGIVLAALTRRGELKRTRDGFVVKTIHDAATAQAGATNGTGA
jgi:hypothetical protein